MWSNVLDIRETTEDNHHKYSQIGHPWNNKNITHKNGKGALKMNCWNLAPSCGKIVELHKAILYVLTILCYTAFCDRNHSGVNYVLVEMLMMFAKKAQKHRTAHSCDSYWHC